MTFYLWRNLSSKSCKQKNLEKNYLLTSWRSLTKRTRSRDRSRSVSQRYESPDPDLYKNARIRNTAFHIRKTVQKRPPGWCLWQHPSGGAHVSPRRWWGGCGWWGARAPPSRTAGPSPRSWTDTIITQRSPEVTLQVFFPMRKRSRAELKDRY